MSARDRIAAGRTVGIVGSGRIAREHARAWVDLGADLTVYSPRGGRALVDAFGADAVDDLHELVGGADLLDVCSPTPSHPEAVDAGIDAGIPILCEKPLALTVDDAVRLAVRADRAGVLLYPAHVVRFFPAYSAAKKAVASGAIGDLVEGRYLRMGAFPTWSPWFADESSSGGIVLDQMIHDLDIARWIAGDVVLVSATEVRSPSNSATVTLTHANGATSTATGIWGPADTAFGTAFSITGSITELVDDTRRSSRGDGDARGAGTGDPVAGDLPDLAGADDPFEAELTDFVRVASGEIPASAARVVVRDGVEAVRIARAAIESARTGAPIALHAEGCNDN